MIVLDAVDKVYGQDRKPALDQVSLTFPDGEMTCLSGPAGAGKTTLLRLLAGMETPSRGTVTFNGQDISRLSGTARKGLRQHVGWVSRPPFLVSYWNVEANVAYPLRLSGVPESIITQRVRTAMQRTGLDTLRTRRAGTLTISERQRLALARAFVNRPGLLLADDPFFSLDDTESARLMEALQLFSLAGITVIFSASTAPFRVHPMREVRLQKGRVQQDAVT